MEFEGIVFLEEPGSRRRAIRSRAVYLPAAWILSILS